MSSAGHILDMIKRIRQNKSMRPSNRQKFQADKRETIYSGIHNPKRAVFTKFSAQQESAAVETIRQEASRDKRREYLLLILCILAIAVFFYIFFR